jgi:hypothetical protein
VYVYGPVPVSRQPSVPAHFSIFIWRPLVASVVNTLGVDVSAVVSVIEDRFSLPAAFVSLTRRWMVSPGTSPLALTVSRLSLLPAEPSVTDTVPAEMAFEELVLLENVAYVPRPAIAAAAPIAPKDSSSFRDS